MSEMEGIMDTVSRMMPTQKIKLVNLILASMTGKKNEPKEPPMPVYEGMKMFAEIYQQKKGVSYAPSGKFSTADFKHMRELIVKIGDRIMEDGADRTLVTDGMRLDGLRGFLLAVCGMKNQWYFDERTLAALILTHLTIVEDMLNVARPMKPDAMAALAKQVAQMLLDDDMSWNFADIQIVMDRLAKGEAGQVYGGLNAPMVTKAFTDYMCEKANAFIDYREREAREKYGSGLGRERTRADYDDAVRAGERVKHMAAREAYQNGTLQKDIKKGKGNGKA